MEDNNDRPVTKAELNNALDAYSALLIEKMRDMQTEILRAFEGFATGQGIRLRKLEADHQNLEYASNQRVDIVERRLFEIEKRLMINPPEQH